MPRQKSRLRTAARKTAKWGGLVLTVLLVVVWVGSGWCGLLVTDGHGNVCVVGFGTLGLLSGWDDPSRPLPSPVWQHTARFHLNWWFKRTGSRQYPIYEIPIWPAALLFLLTTAAAWRIDLKYVRRARAGLCAGCGYDRAGLAEGAVCPECGKQAEAR